MEIWVINTCMFVLLVLVLAKVSPILQKIARKAKVLLQKTLGYCSHALPSRSSKVHRFKTQILCNSVLRNNECVECVSYAQVVKG